jgi:hypothetical protein
MTILVLGSGSHAAEEEEVRTTLFTDGSPAAALSRLTVPATTHEITASGSGFNDTSAA